VDGLLAAQTDVARVTPEEMLSMAFSMMTNRQKQKFKETADWTWLWSSGPGPLPRQRFSGSAATRYGAPRHSHEDRTNRPN